MGPACWVHEQGELSVLGQNDSASLAALEIVAELSCGSNTLKQMIFASASIQISQRQKGQFRP
jgi:hypothetical protein